MADFIRNIKNGVLYDMLWEPLRKTTKPIGVDNTLIPKGSYVCYVINSDEGGHDILSTRKRAKLLFRDARKRNKKYGTYHEIYLIMAWVDPKGNFITNMVIG